MVLFLNVWLKNTLKVSETTSPSSRLQNKSLKSLLSKETNIIFWLFEVEKRRKVVNLLLKLSDISAHSDEFLPLETQQQLRYEPGRGWVWCLNTGWLTHTHAHTLRLLTACMTHWVLHIRLNTWAEIPQRGSNRLARGRENSRFLLAGWLVGGFKKLDTNFFWNLIWAHDLTPSCIVCEWSSWNKAKWMIQKGFCSVISQVKSGC